MKLKKKIISIVTAAVCAVSFCAGAVTVGAKAASILHISNEEGAPGETVYVYVGFDAEYNLASCDLRIAYDGALIADEAEDGTAFFSITSSVFADQNSLLLAGYSKQDEGLSDGTFAQIPFTIPADAKPGTVYDITFAEVSSIEVAGGYDGENITADAVTINGSITVIEETQTVETSPAVTTTITTTSAITTVSTIKAAGIPGKYGDKYENLLYIKVDEDKDGTDDYVEITGCDEEATEIVIPNEIEGLPVNKINIYAFRYGTKITSIYISDNITYIEDDEWIFLNLPTTVESITVSENNSAYSSIDGVLFNKNKSELICYPKGKKDKRYSIPDGVVNINHDAFGFSQNLTNANIPDSVISIGRTAFMCCKSLENIEIPDSVTSISDHAFYYPTIYIKTYGPSSLVSINVSEDNEYFSSIDGVLFNKDKTELIKYPVCKKDTNYIIPDSVNKICAYAFEGSNNLKKVKVPKEVTSIEELSFNSCSELTSIEILNPKCEIGWGAITTFFDGKSDEPYFNGTIYGYENSTAQEYANKYGYKFEILDEKPIVTTPAVTTAITTNTTTKSTANTSVSTTETTSEVTTTVSEVTTGITTSTDKSTTETSTEVSTQQTTVSTTVTTAVTTTSNVHGDADGNGKTNILDAAFIAKRVAQRKTDLLPSCADYNKDGKLNIVDAAAIAKDVARRILKEY